MLYYVTQDVNVGVPVMTYEVNGSQYYVMERVASPIGFAVHDYILHDDLIAIEKRRRGLALLSGVVIRPENEGQVSNVSGRKTIEDIDFDKTVENYVLENSLGSVSNFSRNNFGFACLSNYNQDSMAYFSAPNDNGWSAYIDGDKTDIIDSGGMMLIRVPAGQHHIVFLYSTPRYEIGKMVSILAILMFICYSIKRMYSRKIT